jgi:hypothetical protein
MTLMKKVAISKGVPAGHSIEFGKLPALSPIKSTMTVV